MVLTLKWRQIEFCNMAASQMEIICVPNKHISSKGKLNLP